MRLPSLILLVCLLVPLPAAAQKTYLHCGRLLDVREGTVREQVTVVVNGNQVEQVAAGYLAPGASDRVVDLKDQTVLPGLIDLHVHLEGETNPNRYLERFTLSDADVAFRAAAFAEKTLLAGFTTVRDVGGSGVNVALRNAVQDGIAVGPRIFTSGKSIATTGGHADPTNGARPDLFGVPGPEVGVADGPDACRQAVRQQYKNGADLIKITATGGVLSVAKDGSGPQFTEAELQAIVETARDYGMHVAAHAHGAEGMKRAVAAGVKTIEHGTMMSDEVMQLMKAHGAYYVPTITAGQFVAEKAKEPGYYPALVVPKALAIGPQIQATFAKAYEAGVKIAFGTDAGVFPHGENAREFAYMVEAGMPPLEAIRSATLAAAEVLDRPDLGALEPGMTADLIAVEADPLADVATLQHVHFVMKDGIVYKDE